MSAPRFLADEDLRGGLVSAVRRHGRDIDFSTVNDQGLQSIRDEQLLEFAWRNRWLIVSHDANTLISAVRRRIASGHGCRGVFLVKQHMPVRKFLEELRLIQHASTLEEWENVVEFLPL